MSFGQVTGPKLYKTTKVVSTGEVTNVLTTRFSYISTRDTTNTVRRQKPSDLFANGTSYDARFWNHSDSRYTRPPYVAADKVIVQPVYSDSAATFWYGFPLPDTSVVESRLRAKIKSQNLNLAQSVAEYRQASKMFYGIAVDIILTFRSLRRGRSFADVIRLLQRSKGSQELALANRWLQYQYGLKPLMSDLYGLTDALATKIRDGMYCYVRSSSSSALSRSERTSEEGFATWTAKQTVRGVARYKISDPSMKMVAQLGISNPLLLAWEVIPYSFVVDWLFPVGRFLSSLDALNGVSDLRVITSSWEDHANDYVGKYGGVAKWTGVRYHRNAPSSVLAMPTLGYEPSSSLKQVLNGLALLTQLRRR